MLKPNTILFTRDALRIAGLMSIVGLSAWMASGFLLSNGHAVMPWLPGGLALAALLLGGAKLWPGVFAGAALAGWLQGDPVWVSLAIAAGNTLETLAAYYLLSRKAPFDPDLGGPGDLLLLLLAAAPSCLISALIGPATLLAAGLLTVEAIPRAVLHWWQGDYIGILLGAPLILSWRRKPAGWPRPARLAESLCLYGLAFLAGQLVFLERFAADLRVYGMDYWLFGFMAWAALRHGPRGATLLAALAGIQAGVAARLGLGFLGHEPAAAVWQNYWFHILVLTGAGVFLALTLAAKTRTERKLQVKSLELAESEARFRGVAKIAPVVIYRTDPAGNYVFVNGAWRVLTGFSAESALGGHWDATVHHEDRERVRLERGLAFAAERVFSAEYRIHAANGEIRDVLGRASPERDENGELLGYVGALTDITERKRLEHSLADADRGKEEFLAMLAHELRNPLAPIRNAVQILQTGGVDSSRIAWCGDIIGRQITHLTGLVDDLLDVSRISRGAIRLNREALEVCEVIQLALESSQPLIDARRQDLKLDLPPGRLWVEGDLIRLSQVVSNLINNAVKFTNVGGWIGVSAELAGDWIRIRVRDNGCGINPADLPYMFEMFYQGERNLDRSEGGLGVGLSLVRDLVRMHGGDVRAYSQGLGQGSEFEVRLPRLTPPEISLEPAPASLAARRRNLKVLVVDDNRDVADSMTFVMEAEGHEVETAYDGAAALEMALTGRPDIVLLDIGLPGMDGYAVARALRARGEFAETLLIAITGYGHPKDREMAFEAGFDEHLVKPHNFQRLQKLIGDYQARVVN